MKQRVHCRAFTLIELLAAVAIVACLAGLLMPSIAKVRTRSETVACAGNLHQIGIAALLYSNDHDQRLPVIEPWPSEPIYEAADNAQPIAKVLDPYGVNSQLLTCRADVKGENYLAKEGSSYQWFPMASGQNIQALNLHWGAMQETVTLDKLMIAFDYTEIHHGLANVLFGDGHVAGAVTH